MRTISMVSLNQHRELPVVNAMPALDVLPVCILVEIGLAALNFDLATAEKLAVDILNAVAAARAETPEVAA